MSATLWLNVIVRPERHTTMGELWTVTRPIQHAPLKGDDLMLWPGEGFDPDDGPLWPVRRRFWNANGHLNLELVRMIVDPTDRYLTAYYGSHHRLSEESVWRTEYDGDPQLKLPKGNWSRYGV